MRLLKYVTIVVATVAVTLTARSYIVSRIFPPRPAEDRFYEERPRWIQSAKCVEMNAEERAQEQLVVRVLSEFSLHDAMNGVARNHLGYDRYRRENDKSVRLCPFKEFDDTIAKLALEQRVFNGSYFFDQALRLARRLGPRDEKIINGVATTAFSSKAIPSGSVSWDIRPFARVVLAEFGNAAAPWAEQAFQAINTGDPLGTTAAQIAVAAGHPQAAAKVSGLMDDLLLRYPADPIPRSVRNRFYDLAYALAVLGRDAVPHAKPIIRIMERKVESAAPPFGLVALRPRRMCSVLELIGGADAERILASETCNPSIDVFEQ